MKKLLLFTTLLSASFMSFCPAAGIVNAAPVHKPVIAPTVTPMVAATVNTAVSPLNKIIADLLANITRPGSLTSDIRLTNLTDNVSTLQKGLGSVFIRDLDEKAKTDIIKCIEIMQEETNQLLELFEDSTRLFNKRSNKECKHLLEIQKVLGKMTEKINGVNVMWVAGKNTLSWMNNNRMKTIAILAMTPLVMKATTTTGYHMHQSGFNPFRWITGIMKWAVTPAFAKAAPVAPVAEAPRGWFN